jgi:hypothetical protein
MILTLHTFLIRLSAFQSGVYVGKALLCLAIAGLCVYMLAKLRKKK